MWVGREGGLAREQTGVIPTCCHSAHLCLSVHACMCVYMYMCTYTYTYMHVCMHVRTYVFMCICLYVCVHICMYGRTDVWTMRPLQHGFMSICSAFYSVYPGKNIRARMYIYMIYGCTCGLCVYICILRWCPSDGATRQRQRMLEVVLSNICSVHCSFCQILAWYLIVFVIGSICGLNTVCLTPLFQTPLSQYFVQHPSLNTFFLTPFS